MKSIESDFCTILNLLIIHIYESNIIWNRIYFYIIWNFKNHSNPWRRTISQNREWHFSDRESDFKMIFTEKSNSHGIDPI